MPYDRFLVGYVDNNATLQTDLRPFLINDNAFTQLQNVYVFRGRVRKRFGSNYMGVGFTNALDEPLFSQVAVPLGTTDSVTGNLTVTVPGAIFKIGQKFSVYNYVTPSAANSILTVYQTSGAMFTTGTATGTYDTSTGALTITGGPVSTEVFFYPSEPIMGITIYQSGTVNNQPSYAFDTQFAYFFNGAYWSRSGTAVFTGTDTNFFWAWNFTGLSDGVQVLFVTNFNYGGTSLNGDPIWYTTDGSTWTSASGANAFYFTPAGGAPETGPFVFTAKLIFSYKGHLILLNTVENDGGADGGTNTNYENRCRYAAAGDPFTQNAWYESGQTDNSGTAGKYYSIGGGSTDASTDEAIISAGFIKDRLVVFFERSTWELAWTGNQVFPFQWNKLNTELGSQSEFSSVFFDKQILTIGNTGIHGCNGVNVQRIDNKIPDEVFEIGNNLTSTSRVWGIRDYYVEQVYWTFPSVNENIALKFPNQVLVYNYSTGSWALNDDCITAFGYFEQQTFLTWATSIPLTWQESNFPWSDDNEGAKFRQIIAGNQQGFIYLINPDVSRNIGAMQITNIASSAPNITLTIVDHTLTIGDYILIENAQGVTGLNGNIYQVLDYGSPAANVVIVGPASFTGTYTGGGTVARVSNTQMMTKQYNFYLDKGQNIYLAKADFGVLKTTNGQIQVDYYPSSTSLSMITEGMATNTIQGTGVLETFPYNPNIYPLEQVQTRLWHSIYFQTNGDSIQLALYMNPVQMKNPAISLSDFELQAVVYHVMPNGRIQ